MNRTKELIKTLALFFVLLGGGMLMGYMIFITQAFTPNASPQKQAAQKAKQTDFMHLDIYYPSNGALELEQRKVEMSLGSTAIAETLIYEYLKGPATSGVSLISSKVEILGVYEGTDGVLYVDFSDDLERGFDGDAFDEFLFIRGLYESLAKNIEGIGDLVLLVRGVQIESVGGHVALDKPLSEIVLRPMPEQVKVSAASAR